MKFCVEQAWIERNAAATVRLGSKPRVSKIIVLTDEEVRAFLNTSVEYRTLDHATTDACKHLLVFTGLRRAELMKLGWEHVDLEKGTLTVYDSKNSKRKGLPGKDRDVPLCRSVIRVLEPIRRETGPVMRRKNGKRLWLAKLVTRLTRAA